jgi:hypothetical protein
VKTRVFLLVLSLVVTIAILAITVWPSHENPPSASASEADALAREATQQLLQLERARDQLERAFEKRNQAFRELETLAPKIKNPEFQKFFQDIAGLFRARASRTP